MQGADSDGDGLSDSVEAAIGTDPLRADTDYDEVGDGQELLDGSDPLDRGSAKVQLGKEVCTDWNGMLSRTWNVFEHVNLGSSSLPVVSTLFDINGAEKSSADFTIPDGAQFDLLVHDMRGMTRQSYGKVCSRHGGAMGHLDGGMVVYRPTEFAVSGRSLGRKKGMFEFAYSMPMTAGKRHAQYVMFNTFNPSLAAADPGILVANWIQLINEGTGSGSGTLIFYAMDGAVLSAMAVEIPGGARRDFSGHQFGDSLVGYVGWFPDSDANRYQLRNIRYVYDNPGTDANFYTAFQLDGGYGTGKLIAAPIDTRGQTAVLEVSNVTDSEVSAVVQFNLADGTPRSQNVLVLGPRETRHLIADSRQLFGGNLLGTVSVQAGAPESLIAVAMHYRRTANLGVNAMYGIPLTESLGTVLRGSYNTYLEQSSVLLVLNHTENPQRLQLSLKRSDGKVIVGAGGAMAPREVTIPPRGMISERINDYESSNQYGVITVQADAPHSLSAWALRSRPDEYVIPRPVRE